ncbi:hypothetical protein [Streptomyces sp. CC208A]|uniref:hypothetical protein n=1 Tax=Streptomyces sp. CC208A TaxID=3044573 RepID=UPI0024A8ABDB|nr:hypothetical protein [Streptomyces sp. CC208A]
MSNANDSEHRPAGPVRASGSGRGPAVARRVRPVTVGVRRGLPGAGVPPAGPEALAAHLESTSVHV